MGVFYVVLHGFALNSLLFLLKGSIHSSALTLPITLLRHPALP